MTPAEIVRWYLVARDAPPGLSMDPVKATGLIYAKRCGAKRRGPTLSRKARMLGAMPKDRICSHRVRHWSSAERQWVCGSCGMPWRFWQRRALRGEIQETGTRGDGAEKRLQRLVDVGLAIRRLIGDPEWHWEAVVYFESALGLSQRQIAERGARGDYGLGAPFTWGRETVRYRIQAGGREWRRILIEARLPFSDNAAPV